jgi:Ca-activated chloride channel family protein
MSALVAPLAVSFAEPTFLLVLMLAPLLWLIHVEAGRRARRYPVRFTALDTLTGVLPKGPDWRRHLPAALLAAALAFLALALAKPQRTVAVPVQRASVVLVTDISRSMQALDVAPSRLDAARNAAETFVAKVPPGLRVGLVAFSDGAQTLQTPTADHVEINRALATLRPIAGTSTGAGLKTALEDLRLGDGNRRRPPSAIVLLSDGAATDGAAAFQAAAEARRLRVPIYTVALGTPDGEVTLPDGRVLSVPPDPEALARIAAISGGEGFLAEDADALNAVYDRLGRQLGTRDERRQVTSAFAGVALVLLLGAVAGSLRWGARLP